MQGPLSWAFLSSSLFDWNRESVAEKLLLPLIKRFVSEFSSKVDSFSSRHSKDPEERRAGNRSSTFKGKEGVATIFSISPAEASSSKAVISTAHWDLRHRSRILSGLVGSVCRPLRTVIASQSLESDLSLSNKSCLWQFLKIGDAALQPSGLLFSLVNKPLFLWLCWPCSPSFCRNSAASVLPVHLLPLLLSALVLAYPRD